MRLYASTRPGIWTGTTARSIKGDFLAHLLMNYLISSHHTSQIGIYHLPVAYICADLGSPLEGANTALRRVESVGFCRYDATSEVVFVPNMARFQIGETLAPNDNRVKGVISELVKLGNCPFILDFLDIYAAPYSLPEDAVSRIKSRILASPLQAPYKPLRSQEQEQEQEHDQEQEQEQTSAPDGAVECDDEPCCDPGDPPETCATIEDGIREEMAQRQSPSKLRAGFEAFYALYPLKKDRIKAEQAYTKAIKSGVDHETIMAGLESQLPELKRSASSRTQDGRIPCKYPASWLNAGSYLDEPVEAGYSPNEEDILEAKVMAQGASQ